MTRSSSSATGHGQSVSNTDQAISVDSQRVRGSSSTGKMQKASDFIGEDESHTVIDLTNSPDTFAAVGNQAGDDIPIDRLTQITQPVTVPAVYIPTTLGGSDRDDSFGNGEDTTVPTITVSNFDIYEVRDVQPKSENSKAKKSPSPSRETSTQRSDMCECASKEHFEQTNQRCPRSGMPCTSCVSDLSFIHTQKAS